MGPWCHLVSGVRNYRWRGRVLRAIPSVVLVLAALACVTAGIVEIAYGLAFSSGSGAGVGAAGFGLALTVGALALLWTARGIWRVRPWAIHTGVILSAIAATVCGLAARTAFNVGALARDPTSGKLQPLYDTSAVLVALAAIPFAIAFCCLVITELRLRQQRQPRA